MTSKTTGRNVTEYGELVFFNVNKDEEKIIVARFSREPPEDQSAADNEIAEFVRGNRETLSGRALKRLTIRSDSRLRLCLAMSRHIVELRKIDKGRAHSHGYSIETETCANNGRTFIITKVHGGVPLSKARKLVIHMQREEMRSLLHSELWERQLKMASEKGVEARKAKAAYRRSVCRSLVPLVPYRSVRQAALQLHKLIQSKKLIDPAPSVRTISEDIRDMFDERLKTATGS